MMRGERLCPLFGLGELAAGGWFRREGAVKSVR